MKALIQRLLETNGMKLIRYPEKDLKRRVQLFRHFRINKVLDVGANAGQYASLLRRIGYTGTIISFEPLSQAFQLLENASRKDVKWKINQLALGNENMETAINVAGNSFSSSLLDMLPEHQAAAPESAYVGTETIRVQKLDSIFREYCQPGDQVLLKIDTQGFERQVLEGAEASLPAIRGIQVEMSLVPLYQGEMLYMEMIHYLQQRGFELYSLENGFADDETGRLLQVDGIFFRNG